jgi:hypothetical protein
MYVVLRNLADKMLCSEGGKIMSRLRDDEEHIDLDLTRLQLTIVPSVQLSALRHISFCVVSISCMWSLSCNSAL